MVLQPVSRFPSMFKFTTFRIDSYQCCHFFFINVLEKAAKGKAHQSSKYFKRRPFITGLTTLHGLTQRILWWSPWKWLYLLILLAFPYKWYLKNYYAIILFYILGHFMTSIENYFNTCPNWLPLCIIKMNIIKLMRYYYISQKIYYFFSTNKIVP